MEQDKPKYNPIFEQLVLNNEEDDLRRLIGMIAYAEYKLEKLEWMRRNPNPTQEQLDAFLMGYNERRLNKLYDESENLFFDCLASYSNALLLEEIKEHIDKSKTVWWKSLFGNLGLNLLASFIFAFILFLIAFYIRQSSPESNFGQLMMYLFASDKYKIQLIDLSEKIPSKPEGKSTINIPNK